MNAPRIIASGFLKGAKGEAIPVFVLENGEMQIWNILNANFSLVRAPRRFEKRTEWTIPRHVRRIRTFHVASLQRDTNLGQVQLHQLEPIASGTVPRKSNRDSFTAHRGRVLSLAFYRTVSCGAPEVMAPLCRSIFPHRAANRLSWTD